MIKRKIRHNTTALRERVTIKKMGGSQNRQIKNRKGGERKNSKKNMQFLNYSQNPKK